MLLLKRVATVLGLCVALTAVIYLAARTVGAGIAGARAGAENGTPPTDFRAGYEVGQKAGQEFGQRYWRVMLLGACGLSLIISVAVVSSGAFPWCRRKPQPPKLPRVI